MLPSPSSGPNPSPVHRLPVELLASVFLATLPDPSELHAVDPRRPQTLIRSVCRHWRAVTESTSMFWSTICVILPPMSDGTIAVDMLENAEKWSADQALSLYIQPPYDISDMPDSAGTSQKLTSAVLRLLPRTKVLNINADCSDTGAEALFPIRNAPLLQCLVLGYITCVNMGAVDVFWDHEDGNRLELFSYEGSFPDFNRSFLCRASPRKLFIKIHWTYERAEIEAIGTVPRLEYLHLTGHFAPFKDCLSSSSITSIDIDLHHQGSVNEVDVLGSLPSLAHLVFRLAETYRLDSQHPPVSPDLPGFPALRTITIGMGPHAAGRPYTFCDCLAPLIARAPSLTALEVHHGHALGTLQHLDGTGKKWGTKDTSCPDLKLLRVVFTDHNARYLPAISQSCLKLLEERPSLEIEWHEHHSAKIAGQEGEGEEIESGDEDLSWFEVPRGVTNGVRCFGDGPEESLDSLYSTTPS